MEEREIHLRDYFEVVKKRLHTVATFFGVLFVVVIIGTFSATPMYQATTKVLIEKSGPTTTMMMNYSYFSYDPDFSGTQMELIKSLSVAQRVVRTLSPDRTFDSFLKDDEKGRNIISGTFKWFNDLFSVTSHLAGTSNRKKGEVENSDSEDEITRLKMDSLAKMIRGSIVVTPIKNSKLINISYLSPNPEIASLIVNAVAKAYTEEILEMKMNASRNAMRWLTEKAEEERIKLDNSEKTMQEYMKSKDIVTLENRLTMMPEKLSEVATKIAVAGTKRKEIESLYSKVKDLSQNPSAAETISAIVSDPAIQSLRAQIMKAEQNISELSKKFGQKHPSMITAQEDLRGLKERKDQEIRRVIEAIKNEYELAKTIEENLQKLVSQTKGETLNLNEKFIQYGALKREVETNRQVFDVILKKMKEQGVTQDVQTVDVWVVEKAELPKYPVKPRKTLNLFLGLIIGLFGGVGLAFFFEYLDNTIKSPEDVEKKLGRAVLGIVPFQKSGDILIEDSLLKDPHSAFSESYKVIRTAILLSSANRPPRNILITSTSPEEGKTVTAVNLAMTIAQSERSVLLIDCDLRKPRIHKIFGLDNTRGLSTFLAGVSDGDIITKDSSGKLSIIPAGPIPPNPSELLDSGKMQELFALINEKFDVIIWDSPPLLAVVDSLILSKALDGTIIVAKAGETTFERTGRGLKAMDDMESRCLGIIINALDIKKGDYYYYNYTYTTDKKSQ